jgi:hypothetical protein
MLHACHKARVKVLPKEVLRDGLDSIPAHAQSDNIDCLRHFKQAAPQGGAVASTTGSAYAQVCTRKVLLLLVRECSCMLVTWVNAAAVAPQTRI